MISPHIKQLIEEYKKQLPEYHQETLSSFNWASIAEEIGAKFRMSAKQIDLFVAEVAMLLFQITMPELFKTNIINHIGLSESIAQSVLMDVNNRILTRLQTELTRIIGDAPQLMEQALMGEGIAQPIANQAVSIQLQNQAGDNVRNISNENVAQKPDPYREEID